MANTLKFGNGEWYGKKDTILAYNDENSNYKPLPFDFSRASKATVINKDGLIETVGSGIPRIDYKDDSKGALKLEPQRTNLVTYSSDFSDASWNKNGGTVSITSEIAPDGTTNSVYNYVGLSSNLFTSTQSIGVEYTISFYVKSNGQGDDNFRLRLGSDFSAALTATSEWVRYSFTATAASSVFSLASEGLENLNLLIWGAQLEQGSYATSYIPTQGSAVTRLADARTDSALPSTIVSQTEGTIFFKINKSESTGVPNRELIVLETPNRASGGLIRVLTTLSKSVMRVLFQINGGIPFDVNIPTQYTPLNTDLKFAIAFKSGDSAVYINGVSVNTSTSTFTIPEQFDNFYLNFSEVKAKFSEIKLYNTRLSNSELQALTS